MASSKDLRFSSGFIISKYIFVFIFGSKHKPNVNLLDELNFVKVFVGI